MLDFDTCTHTHLALIIYKKGCHLRFLFLFKHLWLLEVQDYGWLTPRVSYVLLDLYFSLSYLKSKVVVVWHLDFSRSYFKDIDRGCLETRLPLLLTFFFVFANCSPCLFSSGKHSYHPINEVDQALYSSLE